MAKQHKSLSCRVEKTVAVTKTGVDPITELVSVCCDSDYNLPAICLRRRTQNGATFNARLIDDEHREHSII
jgi:hypothetical protein